MNPRITCGVAHVRVCGRDFGNKATFGSIQHFPEIPLCPPPPATPNPQILEQDPPHCFSLPVFRVRNGTRASHLQSMCSSMEPWACTKPAFDFPLALPQTEDREFRDQFLDPPCPVPQGLNVPSAPTCRVHLLLSLLLHSQTILRNKCFSLGIDGSHQVLLQVL